jgi:hypothetical protein
MANNGTEAPIRSSGCHEARPSECLRCSRDKRVIDPVSPLRQCPLPTDAILHPVTAPTPELPITQRNRLWLTNGSFHHLGCCGEWPLGTCSTGRSGSIAVTKPRKLSGRSQTTSGQPNQLLLRPSAKGRI